MLAQPAYFGQFFCDPPEELVRVMFDKLKNESPDLDVILLTGDYVSHAIAINLPPEKPYSTSSYPDLLSITKAVADLLHEYFPDVLVFPT